MHECSIDRLEELLTAGGQDPEDQHLRSCPECRETVEAMRRQAGWIRSLRPEARLEPAPGFYARVMARIEAQKRPSIWSFLLDPGFGPRLALASLALVLLMGVAILTTEPAAPEIATVPERILIEDQSVVLGQDQVRDQEVVLVNLATYSE